MITRALAQKTQDINLKATYMTAVLLITQNRENINKIGISR